MRVDPNVELEFAWTTDVTWFGKLEMFDNSSGTGAPILTKRSEMAAGDPLASTHHLVTVAVVNPWIHTDTNYFFRITADNPGDPTDSFSNIAPLPPVFTGIQTIGGVSVVPGANSALISWDANVIGIGQVEYGLTSLYGSTAGDKLNITDHAIELTGLSPGTTYQFRVSNLHAIDLGALASATGSFTTLGAPVPEPSALLVWVSLLVGGFFTRLRARLEE